MVYTVTFNPSLDYVVTVEDFTTGKVNRTKEERIFPGGKGINVSLVLKNLGVDSTALGFSAGFTGEEIKGLLQERGITADFIPVLNGFSRINVKLRSALESEINGQGPRIAKDNVECLYQKLDAVTREDILVLAGSIPASMSPDTYRDILAHLEGREIRVVVDATKDLLMNVLSFHPFLVKPNHHELGEIFGVEITSQEEAVVYARKLQEYGATNVLVSMAGEGAVLLTGDGQIYKAMAPKGKVVNSVGAGDSMVAGFLYGYTTFGDYKKAFAYGVCTGSASAFSEDLATKEQVEELLERSKELF